MAPKSPLPHAFTPETAPRQGGKPGRKSKKKQYAAEAELNRIVTDMFADLDEMAATTVKEALRKKDLRVSMWYLEQRAKERGTRLEKGLLLPLINAVDTLDDAELVSKQALLLAIDGEMSFEQLRAIQESLARHSTISGMIELKRLREELQVIREELRPERARTLDHAPAWGKLSQKPVEDVEDVEPKPMRENGKCQ